MARKEHLDLLMQGVATWNQWREENLEIQPDLSLADLTHAELIRANLINANLRGAKLRGADLSRARLRGAHINDADLSLADLSHAKISQAYLSRTYLRGAYLSRADLSDTKAEEAKLSYAYLGDADLRGANFRNTDLDRAYLNNANLSNAILKGADLSRADLGGAVLTNTDFREATIGWTTFGNNDLSTTRGLDKVHHKGPSTIGIDTIYRSNGEIPDLFLKGAGVPDSFITYARSLIGQAIHFYSCFISYSSKNHDFAERLYADLQNRGVRCWFAPEDLKTGDKFRQRIDESIRFHDKLLLILSDDSISSTWVEEEVEGAMERERAEKGAVLFPISIDDAISSSNQAWAASLRRMRQIGDFKGWKDHDTYQKAFQRLLRDLKAEESNDDRA